MLSQSSIIAAFLLIGFLVFITAKGQLPAYLQVVGIGNGTASPIFNNSAQQLAQTLVVQ